MTAPATRDQVTDAFTKAYGHFITCGEQGADLTTARVKLREAENAFERDMLDLAMRLVGTAKRMAYNALLEAAKAKLAQAESYQGQGYYCPPAVELFQPIRWAIQDDNAFDANYKASRAVELYARVIADIANSEKIASARTQLTEARARAKRNRENRKIANQERARAQGAHSKNR